MVFHLVKFYENSALGSCETREKWERVPKPTRLVDFFTVIFFTFAMKKKFSYLKLNLQYFPSILVFMGSKIVKNSKKEKGALSGAERYHFCKMSFHFLNPENVPDVNTWDFRPLEDTLQKHLFRCMGQTCVCSSQQMLGSSHFATRWLDASKLRFALMKSYASFEKLTANMVL